MPSLLTVVGATLVVASLGVAIAHARTRRALREYRYPDKPWPLLIGPHNFLDEFDFNNYRPEARALVSRSRRLFAALMMTGPLGAILFFSGFR